MSKDKITTILGAVAAIAMTLPRVGLDFGHFGTATGCTLISGAAVALLGYFTNKQAQ